MCERHGDVGLRAAYIDFETGVLEQGAAAGRGQPQQHLAITSHARHGISPFMHTF